MQIYKKEKFLTQFLAGFMKLPPILNLFKQKMTLIVNVFTKLQAAKDVVRQMSQKPCFITKLDSQHVKGSQTLPNSARQQFCHPE